MHSAHIYLKKQLLCNGFSRRIKNLPKMIKVLPLFLFLFLQMASSIHAQTLTGTITGPTNAPIPNARVTLFNVDTSYFRETRTDAAGIYLIENLPGGGPGLFFGVAKPGFEYFQNATAGIIDTITHNAQLAPETHTGQWAIIMDSPEPLGGTDLGILLPDGRIYYCHNTKDPFLFDPVVNDTVSSPGDTKVQGCAASKLLWNNNIIMAGGTEMEVYGPGTQKLKQFNLSTQTWQQMPNMLDYRWYPSMTQLADGRLLLVGGGGLNNPVRVKTSELYDPITGTTTWADMVAIGMEQSPILVLYSGKVLMTFRPPQLFNPAVEQWDLAADFVQGNRMPNGDHVDHELVHLPEGHVIAIGFKPFPSGSGGNLVERYDPIANTWALRSSFAPLRSRPKTVLTPDRRILVMAGAKESPADPAPVNQWGYMNLNDQYDPYADTWRRLAPMPRNREYHALAVLVPDGRVIVVGGEGEPGNEPPKSIIDAFKPPYLFRGVRPQMLNVAKTDYQRGEVITFDVARTNAPTSVVLQSTQAVTHMLNSGENRFLELDFSIENQSVEAQIPNDSLKALPGWYMLWTMVDDIPSVAHMVRILPGQAPAVVTPPNAAFSAAITTGCAPLTVQFNNTSSSNATNFDWSFPGGIPANSTDQNPLVLYNAPGVYTVVLTATNAAGSSTATQADYISVADSPTASFTAMVSGKTATYINTTTNGTSYTWDFGDGSSSTEANPVHTYTNDGSYVVVLTATNDCGTSTEQQVVSIMTVGSTEAEGPNAFRLYPNPVLESLVWEASSPLLLPESIQLLDANGRICRNWTSDPIPKTLSTAGLPSGVYFLKIKTSKQVFSRQVVLED